MKKPRQLLAVLGLLALTLGRPTTASAGIVLTFDQSNYSIPAVGGTAAVKVFVQQIGPLATGEPAVNAANGLTGASMKLTITDPTIAKVLSASNIVPGVPPFDSGVGGFSLTLDPNLADTSIAGVNITGAPVLLGTFTFTGLKVGLTPVLSSLLDTSTFNFNDANGDNLDPFVSGSTTTITVGTPTSTPEPATLGSAFVAVLCGIAYHLRHRRVTA